MDEAQLSLSVSGMTCAACVASVERVLGQVEGVVEVSVNLPLEKAKTTKLIVWQMTRRKSLTIGRNGKS